MASTLHKCTLWDRFIISSLKRLGLTPWREKTKKGARSTEKKKEKTEKKKETKKKKKKETKKQEPREFVESAIEWE